MNRDLNVCAFVMYFLDELALTHMVLVQVLDEFQVCLEFEHVVVK